MPRETEAQLVCSIDDAGIMRKPSLSRLRNHFQKEVRDLSLYETEFGDALADTIADALDDVNKNILAVYYESKT